MPEYQPKKRRGRLAVPFGWYVHPDDPSILIPDPKKIEALEYAYKMRAKCKTPFADCTQWLHAATGQIMTRNGFAFGYRAWLKRINKAHRQAVNKKKKELKKVEDSLIANKYYKYTVITDDKDAITSVALEKLRVGKKTKKKKAKRKPKRR